MFNDYVIAMTDQARDIVAEMLAIVAPQVIAETPIFAMVKAPYDVARKMAEMTFVEQNEPEPIEPCEFGRQVMHREITTSISTLLASAQVNATFPQLLKSLIE